jgi:hypothetical protein
MSESEGVYIGILLVSALLCGWIGKLVGGTKGQGEIGAILGFFLGPLGILIAVFLPVANKAPVRQRVVKDCRLPPVNPPKWDAVEAWESEQREKKVLPVPEHLRGKKLDEE